MNTSRDRLKAPSHSEWLTAAEAADHLRLPSVNALYQRVARGQVTALRLGERRMRFSRRHLDSLMKPA
jgi:excisionase family DNA binding protein